MTPTGRITILYLPDWYVRAVGRAKVESAATASELFDLHRSAEEGDKHDFPKFAVANAVFASYLYGHNSLPVKLEGDDDLVHVSWRLAPVSQILSPEKESVFYEDAHNLISALYGPHSEANQVENKEERFSILCKAFEDVRIKPLANGDMIVYHDPTAPTYYNRYNLIKSVAGHLIDHLGYRRALSTNLFKSFLSSVYQTEDIRYTFFHKVG